MEIHWITGIAHLREPQDFRAFKVVAHNGVRMSEVDATELSSIGTPAPGGALWVPQPTLIKLAGKQATPRWLENLALMVAKARSHGWIDKSSGDIRAHIEWRHSGNF